MIAPRTHLVSLRLEYVMEQTVYSSVVPEHRGVIVGLVINGNWSVQYKVAWESGVKQKHFPCELQLEPLREEGMDDGENWELN